MKFPDSWRADHGSHVDQLREERLLECALQEPDTARATRPGLEADDALDRLQVAEPPQLKTFLDVDQLLGQFIGLPMSFRIVVDDLEDSDEGMIAFMCQGPVALDAYRRYIK